MNESDQADKNDVANRSATNHHDAAIGDAGEYTMGALELEYPENRGLYTDVFNRYDPEVADLLVDTRMVRFAVELEYNVCRLIAMCEPLEPVDSRVLESLVSVRNEIEGVLWSLCDALAKDWLNGESESDWAGAGWVSGSELL